MTGRPGAGNRFLSASTELEYGVKGWWTSEFYLDGQTTAGETTLFTGYRIENRFRILPREHWINPVLYVELENINGAPGTLSWVLRNGSIWHGMPSLAHLPEQQRWEIVSFLREVR